MAWRQVPIAKTETYKKLLTSRNNAFDLVSRLRDDRNEAYTSLSKQTSATQAAVRARATAQAHNASYKKENAKLRKALTREEIRYGYERHVADFFRNQNDELRSENTGLKDQYTTLEGQHTALRADHTTLQEQHRVLGGQHTQLQEQYGRLDRQHIDLREQYTQLDALRNDLQADNNILRDRNTEFQAGYTRLETANAELGGRNDELRQHNQTLVDLVRSTAKKHRRHLSWMVPTALVVGGVIGYFLCKDKHNHNQLHAHEPAAIVAPAQTPIIPAPQIIPAPVPTPSSVNEDKAESQARVQRLTQGYSFVPTGPEKDFMFRYIPPLNPATLELNAPSAPGQSSPSNAPLSRSKPLTSADLQYYNTINNALPADAQRALDNLVSEYQGITRREVTIPANGQKPFASQDTLQVYQVGKTQSNSEKLSDLAHVVDMLKVYLSTSGVPESRNLAPTTMYTNANDDFTLNAADSFKQAFKNKPLVLKKVNADNSTTVTIIGYRADVHKYDSKAVKY